ncbi:hypothetical protein GTN66_04140, partial [bacterium]|nr:hypothetical protein [bacterium]NIO18581.1 hypothetical protein [bacterium]NIO73592.1 hypothetical protein [bacterium]
LLVRIFDENRNYLTETERIEEFKDIAPGEILTTNIPFDIPAEYTGTYYYTAGIVFEKGALFSYYFPLKISPFVPAPETKKWEGKVQIEYQDDPAIESIARLNLRLVNILSRSSYLRFSASGLANPVINPELNDFLVSYHSKRMDISAGDLITGLSPLTLGRSRVIKVENRLGRVSLVGLVGSFRKEFENDLYGLRGSINFSDNFRLATNYVERKKNKNSIASAEFQFGLSPEVTFRGEYAWNVRKQAEIDFEHKKGNAFQLSASLYYEKLLLDASYEKVGQNFYFLGSPGNSDDCERYNLSLTHYLTNYINGTIYYNRYHSGLSQNSHNFLTTIAGVDLTAAFPKLPHFILTYNLDETRSNDNGNLLINDTVNNLTVGFSYPIGKARVSGNYLRFGYKGASGTTIDETTVSTNYGLSLPWGKRTTFSANYAVSSAENSTNTDQGSVQSVTLGAKYYPVLGKLVFLPQYKVTLPDSGQERKTTTSLGLSYSFTNKSVLRINYGLTNYGEFINTDKAISDKFSVNLSYDSGLAKHHKLQLNYTLDSQRNFTEGESYTPNEKSTLRVIYTLQI